MRVFKPQFRKKLFMYCREMGYPPDICIEAIDFVEELIAKRIKAALKKIVTEEVSKQ